MQSVCVFVFFSIFLFCPRVQRTQDDDETRPRTQTVRQAELQAALLPADDAIA